MQKWTENNLQYVAFLAAYSYGSLVICWRFKEVWLLAAEVRLFAYLSPIISSLL